MRYRLDINLGDDTVRTLGDLVDQIHDAADNLERHASRDTVLDWPADGPVQDANGNTVGRWSIGRVGD